MQPPVPIRLSAYGEPLSPFGMHMVIPYAQCKYRSTDRTQPLRIFSDALADVECISFHPNCNYIVGGNNDRYIRVWDVVSGACVRTF